MEPKYVFRDADEPEEIEVTFEKGGDSAIKPDGNLLLDDDYDAPPAPRERTERAEQKADRASDGVDVEERARRILEEYNRPQLQPEQKQAQSSSQDDVFKRGFFEKSIKLQDAEIDSVLSKIAVAREEGDTYTEVKLQHELDTVKKEREEFIRQRDEFEAASKAPQKQRQDSQAAAPLPEEAARWMARNEWFSKPTTQVEQDKRDFIMGYVVPKLNRTISNQSPRYYEELSKMVSEHFGDGRKPQSRGTSPVAPVNSNGGDAGGRKKTLTISAKDRAITEQMMNTVGMSLDDADTQKAYVSAKIATDARLSGKR